MSSENLGTVSELREALALMDLVMGSMIEGVAVVSAQGLLRYVNDAFGRMAGEHRVFLLRRHLLDVLPDLGDVWRSLASGRRNGSMMRENLPLRLPQREGIFDIRFAALSEESGLMVGVFHDVTERVRLARELAQAAKLSSVGTLAAGVAHEINNPLGVILGFAEGAARRIKDDDVLDMPLRSIVREALRCKKLVENLLAFSRHGASRLETLKLDDAFSDALALVRTQAKVKGIELIETLSPCGSIQGDRSQLQQILLNLCVNAIDAMPGGGRLLVSTATRLRDVRRWAVLRVQDTGAGIPESIRDKIFDPFFTTKEPGKGTGLGLTLVHEYVEKHGGTIEVDTAAGKGTTFTIQLPAAEPARADMVR